MTDEPYRAADGTGPLPAARPAATVVVAREAGDALEVLLLERSKVGAFAGLWVFPGGRVDDGDGGEDEVGRARSAAVREAHEEVDLVVDPDDLIVLSHWTPPAIAEKRYTTWFFVAPWRGGEVTIDQHEIVACRWITPHDAIAAGLPVAPPTMVTLLTLQEARSFDGLRELLATRGVERFVTVPTKVDDALVLLWHGDAGYEAADPIAEGARHRLVMPKGAPMRYERSGR